MENMKNKRKEVEVTLKQLSEVTGIPVQVLLQIERGNIKQTKEHRDLIDKALVKATEDLAKIAELLAKKDRKAKKKSKK